MKICLSGWYFHDPLLREIALRGYETFIVKNREGKCRGFLSAMNPRMGTTGGLGLDMGCYQHYLMEIWDEESDVLFMQDDAEIKGSALLDVAMLVDREIDHAWIFRDEYDEAANGGMSSRAMWVRGSFLAQLKANGGFYVDWENDGILEGRRANQALGILNQALSANPRCCWVAIVPGLQCGRRGYLADKSYVYKRVPGSEGIVTPKGLS